MNTFEILAKDARFDTFSYVANGIQNQFSAFVEQTDQSKFAVQQSLDKLETLKKSLMQKYFG